MTNNEGSTKMSHEARQAAFTPERKLRAFNAQSMLSKNHVISSLETDVSELELAVENAPAARRRYLLNKRDFLLRFIAKVRETVLFNELEPWWAYEYSISSRGAFLRLVHAGDKVAALSDTEVFYIPDTSFTVVELLARTMTIEEYAEYSGRTQASLRQALRRGKFRSAYKVGQEWRISELCEPDDTRGYSDARYQWVTELIGLPKAYDYLKEPTFIEIHQDRDDKQKFIIYVDAEHLHGNPYHEIGKTELEWLEHYLIANPFVVYLDDENKNNKRRNRNESK